MPPTVTCVFASAAAKAESCPTGHARPRPQPIGFLVPGPGFSPRPGALFGGNTRRLAPPDRGITTVSEPSNRAIVTRAGSSSGDSFASKSAPSSTTPDAPAATQPAADNNPTPPRTHAGSRPSAATAWMRMNDDSSEHRPPASCPARMTPLAPVPAARAASSRVVTSASAIRPDRATRPSATGQSDPSSAMQQTAPTARGKLASQSSETDPASIRTPSPSARLAARATAPRADPGSAPSRSSIPSAPARAAATAAATPAAPPGANAMIRGTWPAMRCASPSDRPGQSVFLPSPRTPSVSVLSGFFISRLGRLCLEKFGRIQGVRKINQLRSGALAGEGLPPFPEAKIGPGGSKQVGESLHIPPSTHSTHTTVRIHVSCSGTIRRSWPARSLLPSGRRMVKMRRVAVSAGFRGMESVDASR